VTPLLSAPPCRAADDDFGGAPSQVAAADDLAVEVLLAYLNPPAEWARLRESTAEP
jgi:hypothetical protein